MYFHKRQQLKVMFAFQDEYILLYGTVLMMMDALRIQGLSVGHMGQ